MALEIKDSNGNSHSVTGKGQGVYNTVGASAGILALLQNGVFGGNGILGGANNTTTNMVENCFVSKDQFYQSLIDNINTTNENNLATERRLSNIEAAVSQNAAVSECNKNAIRREIEVTNDKFDLTLQNERIVNDLILKNALCRCIQGDVSIPFSKLSMGCLDKTHVIDTYEARPFREPHGHGGCNPCHGGF